MQELQPHVVMKLVEGRNKQLKQCEKQFNSRQKDLEQRSMETCAVSTTALEGFKTKADKKLADAEDDMKKTIVVLNEMLSSIII